MLRNTFLHVPGIGQETEQYLWKSKVLTWNQFLQSNVKASSTMKQHVHHSIQAHNEKNHDFFLKHFPQKEHWRIYEEFKPCFLDIETTGLSREYDDITLIGLYDGEGSKFYINGKNMQKFQEEISKYSLIITFNGKCFDVPFIQAKFPGVPMKKFHIDLRFVLKDLGFSGGLKRIERQLAISRDDDLAEVDGLEAVRLWHAYKRGNLKALDLLIKYNKADIENLQVLMNFAFEKMKEKYFYSVLNGQKVT